MNKLACFIMAAALCGCNHLFFAPTRGIHSDPAALGLRYEVIKFASADGTPLTGIFFPAQGRVLGTVVHFHGNGQNMTSHYPYSAWLSREGYNVFIFDYRGYGASGGKPGLDGAVQDGEAALRHALKLPGAEPGRIIIFGQSLGGAIAIAAAGEAGMKPAALVVEGTFYSYRGMASARLRRHWWGRLLAWLPGVGVSDRYSPSRYIAGLACPKLFIHSPKDDTVPYEEGRKLFEAAPQPKEIWTPPDGHIQAFQAHAAVYSPRLLEFLKKALPAG